MSEKLYEFNSEAPASPRRKWLVVIVLCLIVAPAIWGVRLLERKRTAASLGESFELSIGRDGTVCSAYPNSREIREDSLSDLAVFPHLHLIDLGGTTSGTLRPLQELDQLRALLLANCEWVDDDQAVWLGNLDELTTLDLSGTNVTDASLPVLGKLQNLTRLDLSETGISDAGLRAVSELTNLNSLILSDTNITDTGLLALRDMPQLQRLKVERCSQITDAGLETCANMGQLREFWVGKSGCSYRGLFSIRQNRRDLMLQLSPSDLVEPDRRFGPQRSPLARFGMGVFMSADSGALNSRFEVSNVDTFPELSQNVSATLTTSDDVESLSRLLRFRHNWDRALRRGDMLMTMITEEDNYEEHVGETWRSLTLAGPAAGASLVKVLPLAPALTWLSLQETTIPPEDFPLELLPTELDQLYFTNMPVEPSLIQSLVRHAHVQRIMLSSVSIDGVDVHYASLWNPTTRRKQAGVNDSTNAGDNDETAATIALYETEAGRLLEKLVPVVPNLAAIEIHRATLEPEHFPFDLVPPRLNIYRTDLSDGFLRRLARRSSLTHLYLDTVSVNSVKLDDPALAHFESLKSLQLNNVKINGVDLADPSLEPFRERVKSTLPAGVFEILDPQ